MRILYLLLGLLLAACSPEPPEAPAVVPASEGLRIVVRDAPPTFWGQPWGLAGLEREMALALGEWMGKPVELVVLDDDALIVDYLTQGQADIAMASLPALDTWRDRLDFGQPLLASHYVLAYVGDEAPDLETLPLSSVAVSASESALQFARESRWLRSKLRPYDDFSGFQLLAAVAEERVPYALVQSSQLTWSLNRHPQLRSIALGDAQQIGWATGKNQQGQLLSQANALLTFYNLSGQLETLKQRYLPGPPLDVVDALTFKRHKQERLSIYWPLFVEVADDVGIDPFLLAAQAYQESNWLRRARSPTGVRGLLMLTLPTAREMGVTDRLNARQSATGGARYFKRLHERIEPSVPEPDRTYLALAAYNLGLGHVNDVRNYLRDQGGEPDRWDAVAEVLPKKTDKAFYSQTRYGYARGWEAVGYVANIRNYYTALLLAEKSNGELSAFLPEPEVVDKE